MLHIECREKVCLVCFRKGNFKITENLLDKIHEHILTDYDLNDIRLPCGLCTTCRRTLTALSRENTSRQLSTLNKLERHLQEQVRRSPRRFEKLADSCPCLICQVAKANGGAYKKLIDGFHPKPGRPADAGAEEKTTPFRLCSMCFGRVHKHGGRHVCNQTTKNQNLSNLLSEVEKERVASAVIREKLDGSDGEADGNSVKLATGGRKMSVTVQAAPSKQPQESSILTHDDIKVIKSNCNLSQNATLKMCSDLRFQTKNRKIFQPNLKKMLEESNLLFDDIFTVENFGDGEAVFCTDVTELIRRVSKIRDHDIDIPKLFKLGVDGGRGSLKCSLSLLFPDDDVFNPATNGERSRRLYGLGSSQHFSNNGVKRLLLLAVVPESKEDYDILAKFLANLNLEPGLFHLCADLKVINISVGIMSHSARYPCPFCHWQKDSKMPSDTMRSFEGIREWHKKWNDSGAKPDKLKYFYNCRNDPMGIFPETGRVIDHIPLPELHIMLGVTNKLFEEMIKVYPDGIQWAQKLNLVKEAYHHSFEGNECRTLLKHVDVLQAMVAETDTEKLPAFVEAFRAFNNVVTACFGKCLGENWQGMIDLFQEAYLKTGCSITTKVHLVIHHLASFCLQHDCGLGRYTEQAFEAVHASFSNYWQRHLVKDSKHPDYGKRLKQAIREFNAANA